MPLLFPIFLVLGFFYLSVIVRSVLKQNIGLLDFVLLSSIVFLPASAVLLLDKFKLISMWLGVITPFALLFSFLFFLIFLLVYIAILRIAKNERQKLVLAQRLAIVGARRGQASQIEE